MATRRVSATLRAVTSSEMPAIRSARPSGARATWARTCTQRIAPSGATTRYSTSRSARVATLVATATAQRSRSSGWTAASRSRYVKGSSRGRPKLSLQTGEADSSSVARSSSQTPSRPASVAKSQARGCLFLRAQPVGDLRHQGGVVDLETLEPLALDRDVDLACEEIGQPTLCVADRRHQEPVPKRLAGLAVIENVGAHRHGSVDRGPDLRHRRGIRVGSLQEAAVAPEDLFARVVAQTAEGVVDEDDRVVGKPRVRDHHGHAGRPDGRGERIRTPVAARDLVDDAGRVASVGRDARPDP